MRKARSDCACLVQSGAVRINRRTTDKPAARVRAGDVLTIALGVAEEKADGRLGGAIRVIRIVSLAARRGPASEARGLYEELPG